MLERASLTEQFSTFIELVDGRFSRWVLDGRLKRSMTAAQAGLAEPRGQGAEPGDKVADVGQFWAVYWYRRWGGDDHRGGTVHDAGLAYGHLAAFVQEACYWAAQKTMQFSNSRYGLEDYFQLAIARLDTVLKYFSPERGSRLDTYAHVSFKHIIRETLRQQKEIDICSDWALLLRLSQKRLTASLQAAGERECQSQILAWSCFKAVYTAAGVSIRQLDQADADIWSKIVWEYAQQRQTLSPVPPNSDVTTLRNTLRRCAAAARAYLYPQAASLNATRPGQEEGELQDTLANPEETSPLAAMVMAEDLAKRRQQQADIDQVLRAALSELSAEAQEIFTLYYRDHQTQQQIAQMLDIKQYTVSRRLSKAREMMLKKMAIWSRDTLHISLTSDLLTSINAVLEEWLTRYYSGIGPEDLI